jgi:hypothetical protein
MAAREFWLQRLRSSGLVAFESTPLLTYLSLYERDGREPDYGLILGFVDQHHAVSPSREIEGPSPVDRVLSALAVPEARRKEISVRETGRIVALRHDSPTSSAGELARGGDAIRSMRHRWYGTLGLALRPRRRSRELLAVSNWHVLLGGTGRVGDPAAARTAGSGGDRELGPIDRYLLDASHDLAFVSAPSSALDFGVRTFGRVAGVLAPKIGMRVRKHGARSGATHGVVRNVHAMVSVWGYRGGRRIFENQIETSQMARPGDSGSALLCGDRLVGITFAGGRGMTFHNPVHDLGAVSWWTLD